MPDDIRTDIVQRLANLKEASFLDEKTDREQSDYILPLSDDAEFIIEQFTSNALLVSQYRAYQEARADGSKPADALELAVANSFEQELTYELVHMAKAYGAIGGTLYWVGNSPCPDIEVISVEDVRTRELEWEHEGAWCIPEDANPKDKWIFVYISTVRLEQLIDSLIESGSLDDELSERLKQILSDENIDPNLKAIIEDLIQKMIDSGELKDIFGEPIGTGSGSSGPGQPTQTPSATIGTDTSVCLANPPLIYRNVMGSGSLSLTSNVLQATYTSLRGAIDSHIGALHSNYSPGQLISITLLFSGVAAISQTLLAVTIPFSYTPPTIRKIHSPANVDYAFTGQESYGGLGYSGNIWYKDELVIGSSLSPIGTDDLKLNYTFSEVFGSTTVQNDGPEVDVWLSCYTFTTSTCAVNAPYVMDFSGGPQDYLCWNGGQTIWDAGGGGIAYKSTSPQTSMNRSDIMFTPGKTSCTVSMTLELPTTPTTGGSLHKAIGWVNADGTGGFTEAFESIVGLSGAVTKSYTISIPTTAISVNFSFGTVDRSFAGCHSVSVTVS